MAFVQVKNVAIRGISACVPKNVEENITLPFYAPGEAEQVIASTGIARRHVSTSDITASDLCLKAAQTLIADLGWEKDSIDLIAFCTQNPDYVNQPNSFGCHEALGLSENVMCIDFYHGCPGWIVSMSAIMPMIQSGCIKRAILLDGDTVSKDQCASNREERPLFGDAGTATAFEYCEGASQIYFNIGTKSEDGKALTRLNGGYRNPYTLQSLKEELDRLKGVLPPGEQGLGMDSMDVFAFAITKVPKAIKNLCSEYGLGLESVDSVVLHQANKMIIDTIAKKLKLPKEKVVVGLKEFGNTTSASIPLALVTECHDKLRTSKQKYLTCAFGTGLSWGAAYFETEKIVCSELQMI